MTTINAEAEEHAEYDDCFCAFRELCVVRT